MCKFIVPQRKKKIIRICCLHNEYYVWSRSWSLDIIRTQYTPTQILWTVIIVESVYMWREFLKWAYLLLYIVNFGVFAWVEVERRYIRHADCFRISLLRNEPYNFNNLPHDPYYTNVSQLCMGKYLMGASV